MGGRVRVGWAPWPEGHLTRRAQVEEGREGLLAGEKPPIWRQRGKGAAECRVSAEEGGAGHVKAQGEDQEGRGGKDVPPPRWG